MSKIRTVHAREILDSRGFPTVEVELTLDPPTQLAGALPIIARAMVPSGASTGEGEALELRDGEPKRYGGKGVRQAVRNVREKIAPALQGREFATQHLLDRALLDLDGTPNKSKLGANAILGVSMAFCRAQALHHHAPLHQWIGQLFAEKTANKFPPHLKHRGKAVTLPVPLMNVINGGKHADNGLAVQEFMLVPAGFDHYSDALRAGSEVFHRLKKLLHAQNLSTGVGDEGGFAPVFVGAKPHEQALGFLLRAIADAGYKAGKDFFLALDSAASEFTDPKQPGTYLFEGQRLSSSEMVKLYVKWVETYPIISIEDGLSEHDWQGWAELTRALGDRCQLVGDDLFVTNPIFLKRGIEQKVANSILIKLNQIGTVSETLETMRLAAISGYSAISSHRSGETEDTFIADLAVGTDCGQIKTGSLSRTDRLAKYNQLLRIEESLGEQAEYAGMNAFRVKRK